MVHINLIWFNHINAGEDISNYQLCFFLWNNYSNKNELLFEIKYDKVYELYQLAKRINHLSRKYKFIY